MHRKVIDAATGEEVFEGHLDAIAFWYERHAEWRLPRDVSEVRPDLRASWQCALAIFGDPLYVIAA